MRVGFSIAVGLMIAGVVGCTTEPHGDRVATPPVERPLPASASLAFTPPIARDLPDDPDLARDGRGVGVINGYEAVVVSETWTRQDDRYRFDRYGNQSQFERRSVSTTVTVRQ